MPKNLYMAFLLLPMKEKYLAVLVVFLLLPIAAMNAIANNF